VYGREFMCIVDWIGDESQSQSQSQSQRIKS
jgi:hypothetical protein